MRVWQHKTGLENGFTKKYRVTTLVWYEPHPTMPEAIRREKCLKEWRRLWKIERVETLNPEWHDLCSTLI